MDHNKNGITFHIIFSCASIIARVVQVNHKHWNQPFQFHSSNHQKGNFPFGSIFNQSLPYEILCLDWQFWNQGRWWALIGRGMSWSAWFCHVFRQDYMSSIRNCWKSTSCYVSLQFDFYTVTKTQKRDFYTALSVLSVKWL